MSQTLVDMPKVTQMLDTGWSVRLFKNQMGTYTAWGKHEALGIKVHTDDFTPEQALTRLAYKVRGEVLDSKDPDGPKKQWKEP